MSREIINHDLQKIVDNAGAPHIIAIDKNTVKCVVDDEWEIFTRDDVYGGHPMSGMASFGPVQGDHRMISHIADDIQAIFKLIPQ